ncbi:MAG: aminotransferase class I/II-fold pyridoxal phosphate-dependent enzyme [Firmicutes bacterium]|nr:aminotransferase class I/II-fold pyridoxal phosphate-dependent enzyme [Bacillota bacterium]
MTKLDQSRLPLVEALEAYCTERVIPFHMPGHKQGRGWPVPLKKIFGEQLAQFDLTEVPGLDDLHCPVGPLKEAQSLAAQSFGADQTFFLVNGSTVGIEAMILGITNPGDQLLVPRHAHRSVLSGMILAGAKPVYLPVEVHPEEGFPLGITLGAVAATLAANPQAKGLFLIHPTFEGLTSDISSLVKLAHNRNLPVVVDEAHGPHFAFHHRLPVASLAAGADLSTQSTHKLLSSVTQTALLHQRGERVSARQVQKSLQILQSTSPSFLLMASLDAMRWQMAAEGTTLLERTISLAEEARGMINSLPGLHCLGPELLDYPGVSDYDPTKLVISVRGLGLTGQQVAAMLRRDYRVQVEMAAPAYVLAMVTIGDDRETIAELCAALKKLVEHCQSEIRRENFVPISDLLAVGKQVPVVELTPREAFFAPARVLKLAQAVGEVAAETVAPYPPGIPLVCPGERITSETVELIQALQMMGVRWQGPADPSLETIQVVDRI